MKPTTIPCKVAEEIHEAWRRAGMPDAGLRIYGLRGASNRTATFLADPGDDAAPRYLYVDGAAPYYLHLSGPTLDEWQAQHEYAEAAREARELRAWATGR